MNLAAALIEMKEFARAQQMLDGILAEQPRFPGAWFNQGVLSDEQQPDKVAAALKNARTHAAQVDRAAATLAAPAAVSPRN